jgi:hypothetical protein
MLCRPAGQPRRKFRHRVCAHLTGQRASTGTSYRMRLLLKTSYGSLSVLRIWHLWARTDKQLKDGSMTTSKKVAPKPSKELSSKGSTKEEKSVAGSDLSQAKGKKKGK